MSQHACFQDCGYIRSLEAVYVTLHLFGLYCLFLMLLAIQSLYQYSLCAAMMQQLCHIMSAVAVFRQLLPCSIDRSNRGNSDAGHYNCQCYWVGRLFFPVFCVIMVLSYVTGSVVHFFLFSVRLWCCHMLLGRSFVSARFLCDYGVVIE